MKIIDNKIVLNTIKRFQFFDLTEEIEKILKENDCYEGIVLVFSKHTTLAIRVNEKENGIFEDTENFLSEALPYDKYYMHNDFDIRTENLVCDGECINGDSHIKHLLLGTSETLPVKNSKIQFGTWQRVLAIELDGPRKNREILIKFIGE